MDKTLKWRALLIFVIVIVAIYYLYPTLKLASMDADERAALGEEQLKELEKKAIHLGLDLRGGMHLVLEVDKSALEEGTDLRSVVDRAILIIRNRVDKFGVAEPTIQKQGNDRIVVQLAGITDEKRAKQLIGQTALLEFKIVKEGDEFRKLLADIDESLKDEIAAITEGKEPEDIEAQLKELAAEMDTTGLREELEAEGVEARSLLSMIDFVRVGKHEDAIVSEHDVPQVKRILELAEERGLIPPDVEILWGRDVEQGRQGKFQRLYLVRRKASITGQYLKSAIVRWGIDPQYPSSPGVSLEFNRTGRAIFSRVTGENVDRRLAIVLDGKVHSAPNIREKIRGAASITGNFTAEQAKDLQIVLEAGALPAP
ncbi:MAG TPA: hypothetical protein ENI46_00725, partial [Firmicutes bacterium]|nr:hypothetical protein [Bacillota bacterium]